MPTKSCPLQAVIFDFDGTLADSFDAITCSVNHVRSQYGLPPLPVEEVRRHVGRGAFHLLSQTVPGIPPQTALECYRQHHEQVMYTLTRLMPGAAEAVAQLAQVGVKLAVCSNKPVSFTRRLLDHFLPIGSIAVVLGPEDVPRAKPAPDMLVEALRRLQVAPAHAVYVGDMDVDIETARQAGVRIIAVATGAQSAAYLAAAHPDGMIASLTELPDYLRLRFCTDRESVS
ncbi:Phosphoglycolate phosphatase [bacterium HR36]|nr:Phosphoglycolate phosphatase [bacterium HR36]